MTGRSGGPSAGHATVRRRRIYSRQSCTTRRSPSGHWRGNSGQCVAGSSCVLNRATTAAVKSENVWNVRTDRRRVTTLYRHTHGRSRGDRWSWIPSYGRKTAPGCRLGRAATGCPVVVCVRKPASDMIICRCRVSSCSPSGRAVANPDGTPSRMRVVILGALIAPMNTVVRQSCKCSAYRRSPRTCAVATRRVGERFGRFALSVHAPDTPRITCNGTNSIYICVCVCMY